MSEFDVPDHIPNDWCKGERDFQVVKGVAMPVLSQTEIDLVKGIFDRPIEIEGNDHE